MEWPAFHSWAQLDTEAHRPTQERLVGTAACPCSSGLSGPTQGIKISPRPTLVLWTLAAKVQHYFLGDIQKTTRGIHNLIPGDLNTPVLKSRKATHLLLYFNQDVNPNLRTWGLLIPLSSPAILVTAILKWVPTFHLWGTLSSWHRLKPLLLNLKWALGACLNTLFFYICTS